jgi:hypothetical protein
MGTQAFVQMIDDQEIKSRLFLAAARQKRRLL